jgi:hypothetical protein
MDIFQVIAQFAVVVPLKKLVAAHSMSGFETRDLAAQLIVTQLDDPGPVFASHSSDTRL